MAPRKRIQKKVMTKGSVIPQAVKKKEENPHDVWAEMKKNFGLEDDEMPAYLQAAIANWEATRGKSGLSRLKPNKPLNHILQAEATLKSLQYPLTPQVVKVCKLESCKELFRTPYESVAYCSDYCRKESLASFGIEWIDDQYSSKNEIELWMGQVPPALIPESVLAVMKYLVHDSEERTGEQIVPWNPKHRKQEQVVSKPIERAALPIEPSNPLPPPESLPQLTMKERLAKIRANTALDMSVQ